MEWIAYTTAALVIVALVVAMVVGARLPIAHTVTLRARYRQPPAQIWEAITNLLVAPNWRSGLRQVERLPDRDGRQMWVEVGRRGRVPLEFEVVEAERRLVTRIVGGHLPFGGSWTYDLAPEDDGCSLTLTEDGEIYSQTLRFLARYVFGYEGTTRRYLKDLGKKFGDKIAPERVR